MRLLLIALLLATSLSVTTARAQAPATIVYDTGLAWLKFTCPASFILDPKSHQGEAKWWARFTSPTGDLAIESMSHGRISHLDKEPGMKSPEDFILKTHAGPKPERTKFDGYDRLISRTDTYITVVFLSHQAEWDSRCYQLLTFTFAKGTHALVATTIDQIITSAQPTFDARRWE